MIKTPVRGMRDILPGDMALRNYVLRVIKTHAARAGFTQIETPALEHRENLTSENGGENEKLIFEVLKRGAELEAGLAELQNVVGDPLADASDLAGAKSFLSDSALRYDLTVPLARYYAANQAELPTPFKSLQIGPVWRADAPQKGRYRQFTQCDFDVLGDGSVLAEIDCIVAVGAILTEICTAAGVADLSIILNDRRILAAVCQAAGFPGAAHTDILIVLDKADKIGLTGVEQELLARGYAAENVTQLLGLLEFDAEAPFAEAVQKFTAPLDLPGAVAGDLIAIHDAVRAVLPVKLVFSPYLVRGMGYYTGPIFEVSAAGLGASIGGGGRYDQMIGQFTGLDVPACGFSIGFERLLVILSDLNFQPPQVGERVALLVSKKVTADRYATVMARADELRQTHAEVSVLPMAHNLGKQIGRLEAAGYTQFEKFYAED